MADFYEKLAAHVDRIRTPGYSERIYRDECVFSFDTPKSKGGLYICLNTFLGFGQKHVKWHYTKTGNAVYLHLKTMKVEIQDKASSDQGKKYEYEHYSSLVILPDFDEIPVPDSDLPEKVQLSIALVLSSDLDTEDYDYEELVRTVNDAPKPVSKYSNTLTQLNNGVKVPRWGWRCEKCCLVENLWLNLTDGSILCGPKRYKDSGGYNHALEHFQETGYPLVVKLCTITSDSADVYSYDENSMVIDGNLSKHLEHFGIEIANMRTTDKTTHELKDEMTQQSGEWAVIQETGHNLERLYGPGYTGLENLGNSCYMNAVMQVVMSIPDFKQKYYDKADQIFEQAPPDPAEDFTVQMTKLAVGILSGNYSKKPNQSDTSLKDTMEVRGIRPQMFKAAVSKNHTEFSTRRQQDAQEFFLHLLELVEKNSRNEMDPSNCFKFEVEERVECTASGKVRYTHCVDWCLALPVPLERAINQSDVDRHNSVITELLKMGAKITGDVSIKPKIPFKACLEAFNTVEAIDDFYSTAANTKVTARKTTKLRTFPDYLTIQLKKFTTDEQGTPMKLDVEVLIPDELDLKFLRGHGLQPGEELLPEIKQFGPPTQSVSTEVQNADENEMETSSLSQIRDGPEKYELMAFISHMGQSTFMGHYVCHIVKDGKWVIFNDNMVCVSGRPPKEFGYLYIYRRTPDNAEELTMKRPRMDTAPSSVI
ncbi:ubiquitin carboxyl-terminal hydrolase 5-like [Dermacentor andersoni]|uniref:ubiquitin carboxyl-terminal hydrolase 5-like n=1 Tax=Dermacentor andersoni TaxID=34620 RepID=UPI00215535A5|nr:ubiquitin carboxyl-terminal hydrolase 5-like [Dermacentor andersoni]